MQEDTLKGDMGGVGERQSPTLHNEQQSCIHVCALDVLSDPSGRKEGHVAMRRIRNVSTIPER